MSRQILDIRERGYISRVNGICWQVTYNGTGDYVDTRRVQDGFPFYAPNCSQSRIDHFASQLGNPDAPNHLNGFNVIRGVNECPEAPGKMIVRARNGQNTYWAFQYPDSSIWHLNETGPNVENGCSPKPDVFDPDQITDSPPWTPPPSSSFEFGTPQIAVLAVIVAAVVIYFTWK